MKVETGAALRDEHRRERIPGADRVPVGHDLGRDMARSPSAVIGPRARGAGRDDQLGPGPRPGAEATDGVGPIVPAELIDAGQQQVQAAEGVGQVGADRGQAADGSPSRRHRSVAAIPGARRRGTGRLDRLDRLNRHLAGDRREQDRPRRRQALRIRDADRFGPRPLAGAVARRGRRDARRRWTRRPRAR